MNPAVHQGTPLRGIFRARITGNTMTSDESLQFLEHLRRNDRLIQSAPSGGQAAEQGGPMRAQSRLWELTDLSPNDFADEVARFAGLERVALQDLLSAPALN